MARPIDVGALADNPGVAGLERIEREMRTHWPAIQQRMRDAEVKPTTTTNMRGEKITKYRLMVRPIVGPPNEKALPLGRLQETEERARGALSLDAHIVQDDGGADVLAYRGGCLRLGHLRECFMQLLNVVMTETEFRTLAEAQLMIG